MKYTCTKEIKNIQFILTKLILYKYSMQKKQNKTNKKSITLRTR